MEKKHVTKRCPLINEECRGSNCSWGVSFSEEGDSVIKWRCVLNVIAKEILDGGSNQATWRMPMSEVRQ